MTQEQKMKSLFKELGIEFSETKFSEIEEIGSNKIKYNSLVTINQGVGYDGHIGDFHFLDGVFVTYGLFEI